MQPIFITGIGTGIGKTIVAAIIVEALQADYWKPVQAGYDGGTDALVIKELISNSKSIIHSELYKLKLAASPHIAARNQGIRIDIGSIEGSIPSTSNTLIIEGAGGLMVPLNETQFVSDLCEALKATLILVSRNYLGSINHSLMTAMICRQKNLPVAGWIFNDQYLQYEDEIVAWSGYPKLASIPALSSTNPLAVRSMAATFRTQFNQLI